MAWWLVLWAWAAAAPAMAQDGAPAAEGEWLFTVRARPFDPDCTRGRSPETEDEQRQFDAFRQQLYRGDPGAAFKGLRRYGGAGRRALGDWVSSAGQRSPGDRFDASLWLFRCGGRRSVAAAAWMLEPGALEPKRLAAALELLAGRAPVFTQPQVDFLVEASADDRVGSKAIAALAGFHREGGGFNPATLFVPAPLIRGQTDITAAEFGAPPPHHVQAVARILEEHGRGVEGVDLVERAATYLGALLMTRERAMDAWCPAAVPLADAGPSASKAVVRMARAVTVGRPACSKELVEAVIASRLLEAWDEFVDGTIESLEAGHALDRHECRALEYLQGRAPAKLQRSVRLALSTCG